MSTPATKRSSRSKRERRVVVGVDGSEGSQRALDWAAGEAARLGAVLEIHAAYGSGYVFLTPGDVKHVLDEILEKATAQVAAVEPGLTTRGFGHDGSAVAALVEATRGAELLVIGSRGLGGFRGLLLGSVSQQCALHAHCPVLIVRPTEPGPPG